MSDDSIIDIPADFKTLPRGKQRNITKVVTATLSEVLVKARSVAENNLLETEIRKKRAFAYADTLERMINKVGPQIEKYVEDPSSEEEEFNSETETEKGVFLHRKNARGTMKAKSLLVKNFAIICDKHAKLIHDLGSTPIMPGGNGPLIGKVELNYNPEKDDELKQFAGGDK